MNSELRHCLYNIHDEDWIDYYGGVRFQLKSNNCNFKFCSKIDFNCTIKSIGEFHYIEPDTKLETIPSSCWYNDWLLVTMSPNINLNLESKYNFNCDLLLIRNRPVMICREFTLITSIKDNYVV